MEVALSFLERVVIVGIGIFALYQCFQLGERGPLSRPAALWTVRICLIVVAAVCFFTIANLLGTR